MNPLQKIRYCINTSTIRGQKLGLVKEIEIGAKVGYDGIEPWIGEINEYKQNGGSLKDLRKRIADHGMTVESAIGFANWIVDDDDKRAKALEQAKREMDLVAQIGGTRIAAPPAGATNQSDMNLFAAAKRYAELIKVGRQIGVIPQVEVWGFSKCLSRLGECVFVAIESGCEEACVLPDVYHIYKGGSGFEGLGLLAGETIQCFHMNDYPDNPPRDKIGDADRVYPGDGVAPITSILKSVLANGFSGALSLELFNRDYWKQDPETVLRTGLNKMKAEVEKAS
ncbi:MAG: sugar phosphate isomerase/epimerase family protein [Planctomycetota bacterium]|nr:sugar phosphate isomerase/epimerase family protein [Planctomycetota bacterium]